MVVKPLLIVLYPYYQKIAEVYVNRMCEELGEYLTMF